MFITKTTIRSNVVLTEQMCYNILLAFICIEHKTEISNCEVVFIGEAAAF